MHAKGLAIALLLCLSATAAAADGTDANTTPFELKGVRLGMSIEDVKSAMPNMICDWSSRDRGTLDCHDDTITFANKPAVLSVAALDGEVVYVAIQKLDIDDLPAAVDALQAKYGEETLRAPQHTAYLRGKDRRSGPFTVWAWKRGSVELRTLPVDLINSPRRANWSSIQLIDHIKYDKIYVPRWNGKSPAIRPGADDVSGDI